MACSANFVWAHLVFWPLVMVLIVTVSRHNRFGLLDALRAALGVKRFNRTAAINLLIAITVLAPIALVLVIIETCPT